MPSKLHHLYYCVIFLIAFPGARLHAQIIFLSEKEFYETKAYFDRANGPDYNLINGRQYNLLYSAISHPYLNTDRYRHGSVRLSGEDYDSIQINYDIINQQVILQYPGLAGQTKKIILNEALIEQFILDGKTFRKMSFAATGTSFFQVVSDGEIACYLLWEKKLYRSSTSSTTPYKYSKQSRGIYFEKDGQLYYIRNRASLTSVFDEAYKNEIRRFIRQEKIRFKSASDKSLDNLIQFCIGLKNTN